MKSVAQRSLVMVLAVTFLQVVAPGAVAATAAKCENRGSSAETPVQGAVFNDPSGDTADKYRIIAATKNNIAGTPAGGIIRIATLRINVARTVRSLIRAHTCGVDVRIIVPGRAWRDNAVLKLRHELGTDVSKKSWITSCDGTCTTAGSGGIMHAKLDLFTQVGGAKDVTIYGSSNLTYGQATRRYNDAFQVVDDADVYDAARRYFTTLKSNAEATFPTETHTPGFRQYFFPAPAEEDFHRDVLERTKCQTDEGPTTVDFVAAIWRRADVARQLVDLRRAGCVVRVLVSLDNADQAVLQKLYRREVPTHVQSSQDGDLATHSKYIAIQGRHRGHVVSTVYCGSLNVSRFSERVAENVMLRIVDDQAVYDSYHQEFTSMWKKSRPLTQSDVDAADGVDAAAAEARS